MDNHHVVHITFAVKRVGGELQLGIEPEAWANPIQSVRMVPLSELHAYGFSERFCELARLGFSDGGTYRGNVANIGL
jgi:hypothetical protein